jgi:hypothetical protein
VEPRNFFQIFWVVQLAAYVLAVNAPDPTWALRGIPAAQAALLGIWLAVGPIRSTTRVAGTVFFVGLIAAVAFRLTLEPDFGGWLGIENGWELLLYLVRLSVVGGFYWLVFLRRGYGLTTSGEPLTEGLLRFRLRHFFLLTIFVALYFGVHRSLDSGILYRLMLVVFISLLGILFATTSLLTSLAVFEPNQTARRFAAYLIGILATAALIAAATYDSMSNWMMVGRTLLQLLVETGWLALSLLILRRRGLRLAKLPDLTIVGNRYDPYASRDEYLQLAVKAMAIAIIPMFLWVGWSKYVVNERIRVRSQIDGRSTPSGMMVFITQADGRADASRETKNRIAPFVSQFFDILNHGGTVYGPTTSGRISILRHWLGDEGVTWILVDANQEVPRLRRAFPEAQIAILPPPTPTAPQNTSSTTRP